MSWRGGGSVGDGGVDEEIDKLFTRLAEHAEAGAHKKALKACDDILKVSPGDPDAIAAKAVALLELTRYDAAVDCIVNAPEDVRSGLTFEHAYTLYRSNDVDGALRVLEASGEAAGGELRLLQLRAQLLYRGGRAAESAAIYEELFKSRPDEVAELPGMATNLAAAIVACGRSAELPALLKTFKISPKASFELAFNFACGLVEVGELDDAIEYLLLAKRQGHETLLDEELDEEEIEDELLPISVQEAYVKSLFGRKEEAADAYRAALDLKKSSDPAAQAVAANNLAALVGARGKGGVDACRRLEKLANDDGTVAAAVAPSVSESQRRALIKNRAIALMHSNHLDRSRASLRAIRADDPAMATFVEAALFMRERKPEKAEEILRVFAEGADTTASRDAQLIRAQIAASAGDYARAIEALRAIPEIAATPACAATLVALHELAGDSEAADAVLDELAGGDAGLAGAAVAGGPPPEVLLRAAERKLKQGHADEAASLCAGLVSRPDVDEEDRNAALAGLVRARCEVGDVDGAALDADALFQSLIGAAGNTPPDAEILEETLPASVVARAAEMEKRMARGRRGDRGGEDGSKAKKRKRKKKTILPKGFDPANPGPPPDPERWLPLRERSSYRGKRKKQVNVRGAQGAAHMSSELKSKEFSGSGTGGDGEQGKVAEAAPKPTGGKKGKKKGRR